MKAELPEGYRWVRRMGQGVQAFACTAACGWLESVLGRGRWLHEWGAGHPDSGTLDGRGPVYVAPAPAAGPDGRERWAFRHYQRGGAAAPLLGDLYVRLGDPRPMREVRLSVQARARGIRTPAVVAGAAYGLGPVYRADLVTELVPSTVALRDALFGPGGAGDAAPRLHSAGQLARALEEARVLHADFSAGNVLVGPGEEPAWVVDLDRCRILQGVGAPPRDAMRRRLERSLRKLATSHGRPLTPAEWGALRSGYAEAP